MIALPGELDALYLEEVQAMQEDDGMAYVTSWERIGEERGLIERCMDPDRLNSALTTILDANTKDEVLQHIR